MFQPLSPSDLMPIINGRDLVSRLTSILASVLGIYTAKLPTDPSLPAIWLVSDTRIDPPSNYIPQGLECLVYQGYGFGQTICNNAVLHESFKVRLIQHDRSKQTIEAYQLILTRIPDARRSELSFADRDTKEELVFTISQSKIIN